MVSSDQLSAPRYNPLSLNPVALLKALRPKQWVKNGLVFLPLVFAIDVAWAPDNLSALPGLLARLGILCLAFCALSSSVYLLNDYMDREADRRHPRKRHRPIASGKLGTVPALFFMLALGIGGLLVMGWLGRTLAVISVLYLAMNIGYSLGLKNILLVDISIVAAGYVFRAVAGAIAIDVLPSPWLYATTAAGALFIVLGRRYAEIRLGGEAATRTRSVLGQYAGAFINQLLIIAATGAWLSYTLYTVEADNLPANHTMLLTIPFVTLGLFRYLYLLNRNEEAEAPEQLISRDFPLLLAIFSWVAVSAAVLLLNR